MGFAYSWSTALPGPVVASTGIPFAVRTDTLLIHVLADQARNQRALLVALIRAVSIEAAEDIRGQEDRDSLIAAHVALPCHSLPDTTKVSTF